MVLASVFLVFSLLCFFGGYVHAQSLSSVFTASTGAYQIADWVVFEDNETVYAQNVYGVIAYSSSNVSATDVVINQVIASASPYQTVKLVGELNLSDSITIDCNTQTGLRLEYDVLIQSANEPVIELVGQNTYWNGQVKGGNITINVDNYDCAAIYANGVEMANIQPNVIWNFDNTPTAGSVAVHLLSSNGTHPSYYIAVEGANIGWFDKGVVVESMTGGYCNHNKIESCTTAGCNIGFANVKGGIATGGNNYVDCRVDLLYRTGAVGYWLEDKLNTLTDCQTLDADQADATTYDIVVTSGASIEMKGGVMSRWNFVNNGTLHLTQVKRANTGYFTETHGTAAYTGGLMWLAHLCADTPYYINIQTTANGQTAHVTNYNSTHFQFRVWNTIGNMTGDPQTVYWTTQTHIGTGGAGYN